MPTSARLGKTAPANKSATETVCGEKMPMSSCAFWYADDITSPSSTSTIEGGTICPSVPEAQMVPQATAGS